MKWEYKTVKYRATGGFSSHGKTEDPDEELNHLGADGWELVATIHPTISGAPNVLVFKRPRKT